jgi:hypothetical protein
LYPTSGSGATRWAAPRLTGDRLQSEIVLFISHLHICSKSAAKLLVRIVIAINESSTMTALPVSRADAYLFLQEIYRC